MRTVPRPIAFPSLASGRVPRSRLAPRVRAAAGLAILSDGRTLVRDPANGRIQVYGPDGVPGDTLVPPLTGYQGPILEARQQVGEGQNVSRGGVPFAPSEMWTYHPDGTSSTGSRTATASRSTGRAHPPSTVSGSGL